MITKTCTLCKNEFPATTEYFTAKTSRKDGLDSWCRKCKNDHSRKGKAPQKISQPRHIANGHKMCTKCFSILPASEDYFTKSKRGKYGLSAVCKECNKAYREENHERIMENKRKHCAQNREYYAAKTRAWYRSNIEKSKETHRAYAKIYTKTEHGKALRRKNYQAYMTRKNGNASFMNADDWNECLRFFKYKDAYTGLPMQVISQDHVIPVSKGGMYVKCNIVPCEMSINSSKSDNDMEDWYSAQPFFDNKRLEKIYNWIGYDTKTDTQQLALV